jgi:hypothetical protein
VKEYVFQIFGWNGKTREWRYFNTVRGTQEEAVEACVKLLKVTQYIGVKYEQGEQI